MQGSGILGWRGSARLTPSELVVLSNNTLLADGTRFALAMDRLDDLVTRLSEDEKKTITAKTLPRLKVNLIWFPQDYFAARERPTNYRQFREKLGLELK